MHTNLSCGGKWWVIFRQACPVRMVTAIHMSLPGMVRLLYNSKVFELHCQLLTNGIQIGIGRRIVQSEREPTQKQILIKEIITAFATQDAVVWKKCAYASFMQTIKSRKFLCIQYVWGVLYVFAHVACLCLKAGVGRLGWGFGKRIGVWGGVVMERTVDIGK